MGQATFVTRLAARDLRSRPVEAILLLVAIVAATTTLTLGLIVREFVSDPFQSTREATSGPDVVAIMIPAPGETPGQPSDEPTDVAALEEMINEDGVVDHSGPFPVAGAEMEANGVKVDVQAVGRDSSPTSVDRPVMTQGGWVEEGGVVVEAAFADAKDVNVGDEITLNGQPFEVVGIAVTAASPPYPQAICYFACVFGASPDELSTIPTWVLREPGLVWITRAEAVSLTSEPDSIPYVLNLALEEPGSAAEFVDAHPPEGSGVGLLSWDDILEESSALVIDAQKVLLVGSGLLIVMAMATVAIVVVGRMAEQGRRIGLLKAVGGTPRLVAAVLLAEHVTVALLAAAVGLMLGWLAAPLITEPSVGLLGAAASSLSLYTVAVVTGVALVVAVIATIVPAIRAARSSTVVSLADTARVPRANWLIAISSRLPVPLLLALRTLGRRPRRIVFSILGIAVTVTGVVTLVAGMPQVDEQIAAGGSQATSIERLLPVLVVILGTLVVLAAVNAVFITWATVLDSRHASAVARTLGATPRQVSSGLAMAQILPALAGAILGVPMGIGLLFALDDNVPFLPPFWHFAAVVLLAVGVVAFLTAIPARAGGRRPVVQTLRSEQI